MKREPRTRVPRPVLGALSLALVALLLATSLGLAAVLSGCSLKPFSTHSSTTTTVASGSGETWSTTTTKPPSRGTTTSSSSSTTSTTRRATTTTTIAAVRATTGDPKAIAKTLKPSVVGIAAVTRTTATMIYESIGTGVIYSATASSAYIITNNHVIERDDGNAAKRIKVTLPSGSTVSATLVGRDPSVDLAVLKVKARKLTPAVFRTDLSELSHGDFVVAIGNGKVLKQPITSGNIIAILKNIDYPGLSGVNRVIESSVPLDHGNSGGPLADIDSKVVGINMAELLDGEGGISLPADMVVQVAKRLISAGT